MTISTKYSLCSMFSLLLVPVWFLTTFTLFLILIRTSLNPYALVFPPMHFSGWNKYHQQQQQQQQQQHHYHHQYFQHQLQHKSNHYISCDNRIVSKYDTDSTSFGRISKSIRYQDSYNNHQITRLWSHNSHMDSSSTPSTSASVSSNSKDAINYDAYSPSNDSKDDNDLDDDDDDDDDDDSLDFWERRIRQIGNPYKSTTLLLDSTNEHYFYNNNKNNNNKNNSTTKNNRRSSDRSSEDDNNIMEDEEDNENDTDTDSIVSDDKSLWDDFVQTIHDLSIQQEKFIDPFWEQIKCEAQIALRNEPQAGPQLYQGILSQPNLITAICTIIAHQLETELIPAITIKDLFLNLITIHDEYTIRYDLEAVATRSPSIGNAMDAILFHNGFHAMVCYRVGHRLWLAKRTGLAYYMQSMVSRIYSADIHPACTMGYGIYVRSGSGVVIGETATVGNDVSILEGVTLGGTGKEKGDRHPKIRNGVIIYDGGSVLGNIIIEEGTVITAKSIVTKPTPPLAIVGGVPARIQGYRTFNDTSTWTSTSTGTTTANSIDEMIRDPLQAHLVTKYIHRWKQLL